MSEHGMQVLIERASRGDQDASAAIIQHYQNRVREMARGMLHFRLWRHLDPEDLVQNVWKSLLSAPHKLMGLKTIGPLLRGMVRNKIRNFWRRQQQCERRSKPTPLETLADPRTEGGLLANLVARETADKALQTRRLALRTLRLRAVGAKNQEDRQRYELDMEIIKLREKGFKLREIADLLDLHSWTCVANRVTSASRYLIARGIRWPND